MVRSRLTIQTLELHCGGEPLRLITSGYPPVPRLSILDRRRWLRENADHVRRICMHEPRGHRDMYGALLLPPHRDDADYAVLWMHNAGYSTACGHGTIAVTTALIEEGHFPAREPETAIRFETPAGLVTAHASVERVAGGGHEVTEVRFSSVPSYLATRDIELDVGGRRVVVDIAYGGAYYGIVDAATLGIRVVPGSLGELTRGGAAITEKLRRDHTPRHPVEADLGFVYGTVIVDRDPASAPDGVALDADFRNATVFADAEVDRSPCGSGTSALLAHLAARGLLAPGDEVRNASLTGAVFRGRIDGPARLGSLDAYETSVAGSAYVTGSATFLVDERDPLGEGFLLG